MYDRVRLDWRVPEREWERFRDYVEEEFGSLGGYLGREAESAMQEYADADGYNGIEERVDRLVEAAGRRPEAASKEKKSDLASAETTRVTVKVEATVKDQFRATAGESENPFGVEFARAIRVYRDGGRAARLERKLDRVLDDAAGLLADVSNTDTEDSLSVVERKTIAIANELDDQFTGDELRDAIIEVGGVDSDPSIEKYCDRVTAKLDVEPHPSNPDLWIPSEEAADLAPGQPRVCRQPVSRLDKGERVSRIRLSIGRRAACMDSGKTRVKSGRIRKSILDSEVTKSNTLDLMQSAARVEGITVDDSRETAALKIDLTRLQDYEPDLMVDIVEYRKKAESGLLSTSTSSTVSDFAESPDFADSSSATMDQLTTARTDGGKN